MSRPTGYDALGGVAFAKLAAAHSAPAPPPVPKDGPMSLQEAAEYLHLSHRQLHRLRKRGKIRDCPRFGKVGTVDRSDVLRLASASCRKEA